MTIQLASTDVGGTGLSTVGTNGQVLTSNGTTLSWVTPTAVTPGGSNTQIQFNNAGAFGGSANLTWDGTNVFLNNAGAARLGWNNAGNYYNWIESAGGVGTGYMRFATVNTEFMRLDSSGNLLIGGTTSPSGKSGNLVIETSSGGLWWQSASTAYMGTLDANPLVIYTNNTERMRIDVAGNVLIGTTATNRGNFTNNKLSAVISADTYATWSITNTSNAVNNTTVTALRFLDAAGNLTGNSGMAGTLFVRTTGGSGANQYLAHYSLLSGGNGTTDASLTLLASRTRGTSPISSVNIANDGGGGAIQITITWANNAGVVNSGFAVVSFVGISI